MSRPDLGDSPGPFAAPPDRPAPGARQRSLVVVANRLPVSRVQEGDSQRWETSPGGLVSAMAPILQAHDGAWVGWPGVAGEELAPFHQDGMHLAPVAMDQKELEDFYQGFANTTLWPLYHDAVRWPEFHRRWWWPYVRINERFAQTAAKLCGQGDCCWVHDYQLQLVPHYLRSMRPDLKIGFFLHIPFPPVELFAQLPWRTQILDGLLGADTVGFQTRYGARNFIAAAKRFTDARGSGNTLEIDGRSIRVDAFPISIDVRLFQDLAATEEVRAHAAQIRSDLGEHRRIILGVDRLDYTKGIDNRLRAFQTLLDRGDQDPDSVVFMQIAVPSRELVPEYMEMRGKIERLVGHINGTWGTPQHVPVHYMYRSLSTEELVAHYLAADVMAVTPLRDGMNLVAKEYVATRLHDTGALVLSEFAGAARELTRALLVNPHDVDGTAAALDHALTMSPDEARRRMNSLRRVVGRHDVHHWANSFLDSLTS